MRQFQYSRLLTKLIRLCLALLLAMAWVGTPAAWASAGPQTDALPAGRSSAANPLPLNDPDPTANFSAALYRGFETDGTIPITVTLSAPPVVTATVDYATSPGSAQPGTDYTAVNGTLTFSVGTSSQTFNLPLLDNPLGQADTTLTVTLSNPVSATLGAPSNALVVIGDSETTAFTVTKGADTADGACELSDCSLREAVIAANAYPGANTINLPAGTYTLSLAGPNEDAAATGDLDVSDDLTLAGVTSGTTIITTTGAAFGDRVFQVMPSVTMTVTDVTVAGGDLPAGVGGGFLSQGSLSLTRSTVFSNTADSGGALYVYTGTQALVEDSSLIGNQSQLGAAIFNAGDLVLSQTAVLSNTATDSGVIQNGWFGAPGTAMVVYSQFAGNDATFRASGIQNWTSSTVSISQTNFEDNQSTYPASNSGVLYNAGTMSVTDSSFVDNRAGSGAAIYNDRQLLLSSSTFTNNQATGSGGAVVSLNGSADISGTTFFSNSAGFEGGAVYGGALTLTNSSLTNNTAVQHGGAIASVTDEPVFANAITVTNNSAQIGGGIFSLGELQLFDSQVMSNSATADGGGVYSFGNGTFGHTPPASVISQTAILSNTANNGGGIYANYRFELAGSTLVSNTAASHGGGLYINSSTQALVQDSQFTTNRAASDGGGLYNLGTLTVTASQMISNVATRTGGGIDNDAAMQVISSTFTGNQSGLEGGGIVSNQPTEIISDTFSNNQSFEGGGISIQSGSDMSDGDVIGSSFDHNLARNGGGVHGLGNITITASIFDSNVATICGGGIEEWPQAVVSNTVVVSNTAPAGGGICATGIMQLSGSTVMSNTATDKGGGIISAMRLTALDDTITGNSSAGDGGGIYNNFASGLQLSDSTISGNTAASTNPARGNGGGIYNLGAFTSTNTTLSGNLANGNGGGLYNAANSPFFGPPGLNNLTIADNVADQDNNGSGDGGGIFLALTTTALLSNTIIAGNIDLGGQAPDCAGTLTSGGHNLIQSTAGCTLSGTAPDDITGTAALLGPLQDNGGSTWTLALLAGSPAVDAGSTATPGSGGQACEAADQRGVSRPQGFACDMGAYEAVGLSVTATVQFAGSAFSTLQTAGTAPITVTLSNVMPVTVTVQFSTTNGSALAGHDYVAGSGTVTFTPGVTLTTFAVVILPDGPNEPDQAFTVALATPSNASVGTPNTATVTIHDDMPQPSVALSGGQYAISEGGGAAIVTATLSVASDLTATVQYATSDGTALAGSDYTAVSGTLTFTPGLTKTTFAVPITPDAFYEGDESFGVTLSQAVSATLGAPYAATVTIHDDNPAPAMRLSSAAYTVTEGAGTAVMTATLSAASEVTATVHYAISDGTALAGSDYTAVSGTLTFTPGLTKTTFAVPITQDSLHEQDETFGVGLSNAVSASLSAPHTATVTIHDDDPMPAVRFSSAAYTETESGGAAAITVTLSAASGVTATVHYASSNGTATAGSDYTPVSGTLTFAPGLTQTTFAVPITNDTQLEAPETVLLNLSSPAEAALAGSSSAMLTILDDEVEHRMYLPVAVRP